MSGLPISASDPTPTDAVQNLWRLSALVRAGRDLSEEVKSPIDEDLSPLERATCLNVQRHLVVTLALLSGNDIEYQAIPALVAGWDDLLHTLRNDSSKLTPKSHAFHMRLASKYADYYRSFEQKTAEQWVSAARLKSDFLNAVVLAHQGKFELAAMAADAISKRWRESLPPRLPGLYDIEGAGAGWASRAGNSNLATNLSGKAGEGIGRLAPYEEDSPDLATAPRSLEVTLRFGFAASVLPPSLLI